MLYVRGGYRHLHQVFGFLLTVIVGAPTRYLATLAGTPILQHDLPVSTVTVCMEASTMNPFVFHNGGLE